MTEEETSLLDSVKLPPHELAGCSEVKPITNWRDIIGPPGSHFTTTARAVAAAFEKGSALYSVRSKKGRAVVAVWREPHRLWEFEFVFCGPVGAEPRLADIVRRWIVVTYLHDDEIPSMELAGQVWAYA